MAMSIKPRRTTGKARKQAVVSRKGGIGKTLLATALASHYALRGNKTILFECDDHHRAYYNLVRSASRGQHNLDPLLTTYALFNHNGTPTLTHATHTIDLAATVGRARGAVQEAFDRIMADRGYDFTGAFDLIPGTPELRGIERAFGNRELTEANFNPNLQFSKAIAWAEDAYDVIIIDTPPTLTEILWNVVFASDELVMPIGVDPTSIYDYDETMATIREIWSLCRRTRHQPASLIGIVANMVNRELPEHNLTLESYTKRHLDGNQQVDALLEFPLLGVVPTDQHTFWNAVNAHMTAITWAPRSPLGQGLYEACTAVEAAALAGVQA